VAVSLKYPQDGDIAEISDINVTPFIDVILVLLIIFMVAAPLSTVDVPVELPVSNAQPQPRPDKPVFLTIKSDLSLAIGDDSVPRETLQASSTNTLPMIGSSASSCGPTARSLTGN
jgi:biopolymer transport protein ExbD